MGVADMVSKTHSRQISCEPQGETGYPAISRSCSLASTDPLDFRILTVLMTSCRNQVSELQAAGHQPTCPWVLSMRFQVPSAWNSCLNKLLAVPSTTVLDQGVARTDNGYSGRKRPAGINIRFCASMTSGCAAKQSPQSEIRKFRRRVRPGSCGPPVRRPVVVYRRRRGSASV